jgi:S-adenosylmethionine decarboxylase
MLMTQILADLYGCGPVMEDGAALAAAAKEAAQAVGAKIVGEYEIRYVPHGLTVIVFLGESHILLTTWPEYGLTLLDILLCNPEMDPGAVAATIKDRICPNGRMVVHQVPRRINSTP